MTDKSFGILLAVTAGILWSTIGLSIKSIDQANVFQILFYRSIFISIFIGLLLHFLFKFNFLNLLKNWVSYFAGGTALFFAYIGGIYALLTTSAANALLLFACAPIFTAIFVTNIAERDNIPQNYNINFNCLSWCFNNGLE